MMERFKKHCETPITWGAYYKVCGVSLISYAIFVASLYGVSKYQFYRSRRKENSKGEAE